MTEVFNLIGKGVQKAVNNINEVIVDEIIGIDALDQIFFIWTSSL